MTATITSIAHYYPDKIYDNKYFESYLDTTDEWIITRTGIKERHILEEGGISSMAIPAAKKCLERKGVAPEEIDHILVSTVTPDRMFPPTASIIQREVGCKNAWGFDLEAACSGFIYGLITAKSLVESGIAKKLLLVGADKMSSIVDYQDRAQCILFGDAAAVCLIEESNDPEYGLVDYILRMDGSGEKYLNMEAGGSLHPTSFETVKNKQHYIFQEGQQVFKAAVKGMADVSVEIMERNNLTSEDISYLVPHQANMRIINATAQRMKLEREKVMINIDRFGNTTAATIPLCMSEWYDAGKVKKGDYLVLSSFGAGFTWGSILLKWNMND